MKTLLGFTRPYSKQFMSAIALSAGSLIAAMGLLACSAWLISEASTRPPVLVLEVAIVAVRTFGLSRGVFKYASRIIEHNSALRVQGDLRARIYENLAALPFLSFSQYRKGQAMQGLVHDVDSVQDIWLRLWNPLFSGLITGVAGIGLLYALIPTLALWVGILFLTSIAAAPFIALVGRSSDGVSELEAELFDRTLQSFESVDESLIFGYQATLLAEVEELQKRISGIELRSSRWSGIASAIYAKTLGLSLLISILYASSSFATGKLPGVDVAVAILLPLAIFDSISSLPAAFSKAQKNYQSLQAIKRLLAPVADVLNTGVPQQAYSLLVANLEPLIPGRTLPSFNGEAVPGKPWIVTGKSGLGKSSLLSAITGSIDYTGDLILNGSRVERLDPSICTLMLQDDYLFVTSIRENLKIAKPDASDEELFSALEIVELAAFVKSLPDGLDTLVGVSGYNFSGGEKQRLRLARVLLRDTPIYLLDEPFEYLSSFQAHRLASNLFSHLAQKVVVVVSHLTLKSVD